MVMGKTQWTMVMAIAGLGIAITPARGASLFGSQDLEPQAVAAIAVPLQDGNRYNLLILEQLQNQQPCWRERGEKPTVVDPLLMNFDFTGLCNRSTDSNGYSLRLGGQDQEWRYQFVLRRGATEVKLLAIPAGNSNAPTYEVGSTKGLTAGYLKIYLHPGWRLTQRVYQGKTLPHFYLASDRPPTSPLTPSTPIAALPSLTTNPPGDAAPSQWAKLPSMPPTKGGKVTASPLWQPPPLNSNASDLPPPPPLQTVGSPPPAADNGGWVEFSAPRTMAVSYRVVVPDDGEAIRQQVKSLIPDAFRIWTQGRPMIQAGAFQQATEAESLQQKLRSQGLLAQVVAVP